MPSPLFLKNLDHPDKTADFAACIAGVLQPGDILLLQGDIGAGKTHFARCLIQSIQETPEDVPSPTFTLVQIYDTLKGEVFHADLYRVTGPSEIEELGLYEAFDTGICLIEWPDRLGEDIPGNALTLVFEAGETSLSRTVQAISESDAWTVRLKGCLP